MPRARHPRTQESSKTKQRNINQNKINQKKNKPEIKKQNQNTNNNTKQRQMKTQMIKTRTIVLMAIAVLMALPVDAQYRSRYRGGYTSGGDNYHFGYISGGLGYTSLQCEVPDVKPGGSLGGFVGAGYEFRNNGLWLSAGVQLNFHRSDASMDDMRVDREGYDTQGKEVTLHYKIRERDMQKWAFIEIPVMVGWFFKGFHIGAGPKIGYAVDSRVTAEGIYELSATNKLYGIEFKDMPDRGYTTYEFSGDYDATLSPLVSVVGEIGYDVLSSVPTRSSICHVLKVAFYFEYGINALVKPVTSNKRLVIDQNDATNIQVNPYFAAGMTEKYRVVPFFTGAKLTYLIGGSKGFRQGGYHKGCHCYNH